MSMNSLHQLNPEMSGGFYAEEIRHELVLAAALNPNFTFERNRKNAGHTAFNEALVQVGYMKERGIGGPAATLVGYRGTAGARLSSIKTRVRNMGPHKVRKMHESMKQHGLIPPVKVGTGNTHPLFYAFERLLQIFFDDYEALLIPQRISNWVPVEGKFYYHWWIDREEVE